MSVSQRSVNDCPLTGIPFLFDLRLRLHLQVQQTLAHNSEWILVQPQVSPNRSWVLGAFATTQGILFDPLGEQVLTHGSHHSWGFLVLDGFVGNLCCFRQLLNPVHSSKCLWKKSSVVAEVTHILSRKWLLQTPSRQLSGHNKLGVCRKRWLRFDLVW